MNKNSRGSASAFMIGAVAVLALILSGIALSNSAPVETTSSVQVGASAGTEHYNYENFYNGILSRFQTEGGKVLAIATTSSTYTLSQNELLNNNATQINPSAALSLTLPASSTMTTLIKGPGDWREYMIYNAQTGAASTTTIVGGTGVTLISASSTAIVAPGKTARLQIYRRSNTDVQAMVTLYN